MKRTKQIIIAVLVMFVLAVVMTTVYAEDTNTVNSLEDLYNSNAEDTNTNENTNAEEDFEEIPVEDTNTNANTNDNIDLKDNTENEVKDLPDSGLDTSIIVIIAICGISAIYAYKKIKDYNIK